MFTYFLLKGLNYNKDSRVTLGELILYISEQVRRETRNAQSPTVASKFDPALSSWQLTNLPVVTRETVTADMRPFNPKSSGTYGRCLPEVRLNGALNGLLVKEVSRLRRMTDANPNSPPNGIAAPDFR